jgi:hypothetical protein
MLQRTGHLRFDRPHASQALVFQNRRASPEPTRLANEEHWGSFAPQRILRRALAFHRKFARPKNLRMTRRKVRRNLAEQTWIRVLLDFLPIVFSTILELLPHLGVDGHLSAP